MMRRAALLAVVITVSSVAAAMSAPAAGSTDPVGTGLADSNRDIVRISMLTVNATTEGFASLAFDVSTALALSRDDIASRIEGYTLDAAFERATNDQARREILSQAATRVGGRISALRAHERALRRAYASGSVDSQTFVRGLVRTDAKAARIHDRIERIRQHADSVPGFSLRSRLNNFESELVGLEGPVRDRATAILRGKAPRSRMYVAASSNGVTLSLVRDEKYVREAYRADRRDSTDAGGIGIDTVFDLTTQLYPNAYNQSVSIGITSIGAEYRITINFTGGELVVYLDGDTEQVFSEVQRHSLDLHGKGPSVTATENGTHLTVNRTYAGGPLRVMTRRGATGEPVNATISVAGKTLGHTGENGVYWTLGPPRFATVTASVPAGNVSVRILPLPRPSVNE